MTSIQVPLLTLAQAAHHAGLTPHQLTHHIDAGTGPHHIHLPDGRLRISPTWITEWQGSARRRWSHARDQSQV